MTKRLATGGSILVYHGVVAGPAARQVGTMHVPLARMAATIRAVQRVATFVPLREIVSRHLGGRSTRGLVAITCDDAYVSVLTKAWDLLNELAVPVTLFVVIEGARTGAAFWWDRVDHAVTHVTPARWRAFERECGLSDEFRARHARGAGPVGPLRQWILGRFRGSWPAELDGALASLENEFPSRTRHRPLTFSELDDFVRHPLIDIGPHTVSHRVLPLLGDDEIRREIRESMDDLRARYPRPLAVLAPPFGLYDDRTVRIAREEDLVACLTLEGRQLHDRGASRSLIPRFGLTAGHKPWKAVLYTWGCWYRVRRPGAADRYPDVPSGAPPMRREAMGGPAALVSTKTPSDRRPAKRVLVLAEDLGGGTGNHVCKMLAHWSARGWRVVLVTQTPPQVHELPEGVRVHVTARGGWLDRFPLAQARRLLAVRGIVRRVVPDVVHSYFFWSIMYGRVLKVLGAVPRLVENREDTGFSWGRGSYALLRLTRRVPDRVICVADAVRRVVIEREAPDPQRVLVVRNGVESEPQAFGSREDARRRLGFRDDEVVIGMVANLPRAVKGGGRLLDAVSAIVAAAPAARFLLVGVGTEPAEMGPDLQARGIADYVVGVGYRRDVHLCYAAMDISVLTSSTEGLSITLLESMQHGLPVVVTRVGGNPEVVVDGVTGYLVPVDEREAFVERVVSLVLDADRRRAMGAAGRRHVAEQFGLAAVARRYLAVYEDVLNGAASSDGGRG